MNPESRFQKRYSKKKWNTELEIKEREPNKYDVLFEL